MAHYKTYFIDYPCALETNAHFVCIFFFIIEKSINLVENVVQIFHILSDILSTFAIT